MRRKVSLLLLILLVGLAIFVGYKVGENNSAVISTIGSISETSISTGKDNIKKQEFSQDDLKIFKLIKKYYNEFEYSLYYEETEVYGRKMIFERSKQNNLYFDSYEHYVSTYEDYQRVNYSYDAGQACWGYGSYYIINDNLVIKIEKSGGTNSMCYEVSKNGEKIDEKRIDFD
jgi:hypothetical protein